MGGMPSLITNQEVFVVMSEDDGDCRLSASVGFQGPAAAADSRFNVSVCGIYTYANTPIDACKKAAKRLRALADELDKATWPE